MKTKSKNNNFPDKDNILTIFHSQNKPIRLDVLLRQTGVSRKQKNDLDRMLRQLEEDGDLVRFPGGKWALASRQRHIIGRFSSLDTGAGFVDEENGGKGKGVFILPHHTGKAWHGDLVRAVIEPGSGRRSGKIVEILERAKREIPARVSSRHGHSLLCKPVDRHIQIKFSVPIQESMPLAGSLRPGSLILLHPEKELASGLWEAALLNIFGSESQIDVQENIVKCGHNVPREFPDLAVAQARGLPTQPSADDFAGREDLRAMSFVTIDGPDARDFDDAIYVEKSRDGWVLRVAIADVAHYVRPDSRFGSLDQSALSRGNSWYFPTSVEPMLPEELSNGLCSLCPDEDRLGMLAEIHFDRHGDPGETRFAQVVIRSAARLTYGQTYDFLNGSGGAIANPRIGSMLRDAYDLYKALARASHGRGALDFELPEPSYKFDAAGALQGMGVAERNDAHKLIEQFMIAANEAVARFLGEKHASFLYRDHPVPDKEKLMSLFEALRATSPEAIPSGMRAEDLADPRAIQNILERAKGAPCEYVVNRLCLRSLAQARYQPENLGHFGLASSAYCHFTSPIRRYADLLTHRALKNALNLEKTPVLSLDALTDTGAQLNKLEREALECEREIAKRLACVALRDKEGEKARGTISGVTDFGLFVELDSIPAEGLIRVTDLSDDYYEYDEREQRLVGQRTGKIWKLGQPVNTRVQSVDLDRMEIRLSLPEIKKLLPASRKKSRSPRRAADLPRPSERKTARGHRKKAPARWAAAPKKTRCAQKRRKD